MKDIIEILYREKEHEGFDREWLCRKNSTEWWFVTGVLNGDDGVMYSYQIVLLKIEFGIRTPWIVQFSITNLENEEYYYFYELQKNYENMIIDEKTASLKNKLVIEKKEDTMHIKGIGKEFSFDFDLDYGKGAFWHGDNGLILMGSENAKGNTIYFSYPNMPTSGTITYDGKTLEVSGKSWIDKQGGLFSLTNRNSHWEWFSLRFFDEEEIMIFSFPQNDYLYGSYIKKDSLIKIEKPSIKEDRIVEANGLKYSSGWKLDVPGVKDERYSISPIVEGKLKGMYFEHVCYIYNEKDEKVGLCIVELLPGVRNINFLNKMF